MPIEIFCCYAHEDESLLKQLKVHLAPLQRQGLVKVWYDGDINAGAVWSREVSEHIDVAQIILLLVSPDFMASDYCYTVEMKRAVERHEQGEARIIPIILRPVYWQDAPFSKLQALPKDARPVIAWRNQDEAFYNVTEGIRKIIDELATQHTIEISIEEGNVRTFEADVLALKYAQEFYGTDEIIVDRLIRAGIASVEQLRPDVDDYCYVDTKNCISAYHTLFVGVNDILEFDYQQIQKFATRVLTILANIGSTTKHLVMTIHGVGFGLDEIEAFLSQFDGYVQALQNGQFPPSLEKITIIDINSARVQRLRRAFDLAFTNTDFISKTRTVGNYLLDLSQLNTPFKSNHRSTKPNEKMVIKSEAKPHVFVAMPFKKDMDDVFYYGIQQPVRAAGFICERVDQEAFIGDILEQVKKKIETAAVVIAELSGANPNVYLEVGYAWGKERPTILLMKDDQELRFDVRGQRCLKYQRIKDLEDALKIELEELQIRGFI